MTLYYHTSIKLSAKRNMKNIIKTIRYKRDTTKESQPFPTEDALVTSFSSLIMVNEKNISLTREFNCGFGIADIVIFKILNQDDAMDLGKISADWAFTLRSLPLRKKFNVETVSVLSGASTSASKKAIKEFIEAGFCEKKDNNFFIKIKNPKPLCKSIIAIEAKLKDWKRALWQASRYKIFSNQSWVVLDKHCATPAISNIKEFEKYNIGLATVTADGIYEEIFSPEPDDHKSELAFWKANSLLAKEHLDRVSR
ncbi:hypothetical protein WCT82_19815 [Pectobacterium carotovorum]|uniref:hypothetical protein n=1 Tax=Pectobacterium TaxID=122277 RepID=UPI000A88703C|nr:hypothetical protein [Pectobacterium brasiliense]